MTSIVTGTEQRIYGFLSSNCNIWLKRFAICLGSSTSNPSTHTGTVVYGDTVPYKQCGYMHAGHLSLLFITSGAILPYAVFEVRKCASGKNYIFIDSYGEVASATIPISLWFNQGSETEPNWTLINSCTSGILTHPASEITFKFIENKGSSLTVELRCCKKCESCGCATHDIAQRFKVYTNFKSFHIYSYCCTDATSPSQSSQTYTSNTSLIYGVNNLGEMTVVLGTLNIEYTITNDEILTWIYENSQPTYSGFPVLYYYTVSLLNDDGEWDEIFSGWGDEL